MRMLVPCLAGSLLWATVAWGEPPNVLRAVPAGLVAGQPVEVTFVGKNIASVNALWSDPPLAAELVPPSGDKPPTDRVTFRLTAPTDQPVGPVAVRLSGSEGVSNVRLLFVDDLPTVAEQGNHATVETAQEVPFPCAIEGACESESYDYYRVALEAGQRITVDVLARRLGSPLDPVVRLLDTGGRELAYSDDDDTSGADSRLSYVAPQSDSYLLEIRDIRYQGNADYRYRLRLANTPLLAAPFPLAAARGSSPRVELIDVAGAAVVAPTMTAPSDSRRDWFTVAAQLEGGVGAAPFDMQLSDLVEQVEWEPNDSPETATNWSLGGAINGRFDAPRDRDWYEFTAEKGARWLLHCQSRQFGSPSELYVRVHKADGGLLAELAEAGADDGVLDVTFPEEGSYRMMVEELHRRGGPAFVYRIVSQPYAPGFTLASGVDVANAPQGGVVAIPVTAVRRGYDGPITLAVEGVDGLKLSGQTIAEKKNDTNLLLTVPESLPPGSLAHLRITGTAKLGEETLSAVARCSKALSASLAGLPYPPPSLGAVVALGVGPSAADFFELSIDGDSIVWPQGASTVEATVTLKRLNNFNDPVQLAVKDLPAGVTAEVAPIAAGQTSAKLTLTGPPQMPAGDYPLSLTGTGTHNLQPKQVELVGAKIRVVPPVELALEAPDRVAPGSGQKLKVTVSRHAVGVGEVAVSWVGLPAGIRIHGPETIAADANSAEYTVQVESSVAVPSVVLRAVANAVVGERPVRCSSPVSVLRIESVQVARP